MEPVKITEVPCRFGVIDIFRYMSGEIEISQGRDEISVTLDDVAALISALQAALPDSTPPTVSKGDGA